MIPKKRFPFVLIILLFLLANNLRSQNPCGFDHEMKKSIESDPAKKMALDKFIAQVQNYKGVNQVLGGQINYIIPVVVHVIHDNGPSNISDAQIKDAIRILNEDFQKRNADTSKIVPPFISIIGDIGVEFRLAAVDPYGNCTNGITRTFSYLTNAGNGPAAKSLISWDTQKYYNIWIVEYLESGGNAVGGYSYLPGTAPSSEKEGSIIINGQFGNIGTSYKTALARATVTHETGHFFGLYHTWGIYTAAGSQAACGDDDGIYDTPNTTGTKYSCNTSQTPCGVQDNVQNYMDYSSCPYMFTEGQKTKMIAALNSSAGYRSNLWSVNNLNNTGVNDGYVIRECPPKVDFYSTKRTFCTGDTVTFYDNSYNDSLSTNRSYEWTFEGGTPSNSNNKKPIVAYSNSGKFKVKLKVSNSKGADSLEKASYIEIFSDNLKNYVYFGEGFEDPAFPKNNSDSGKNWYVSSPGNIKFTRNTVANTGGNASVSVDLHTETGCNHSLISPDFDFSTTSDSVKMSFDYAYAQMNTSNADVLRVQFSDDCGKNWNLQTSKNTTNLITKATTTSNFVPASSEWKYWEFNFGTRTKNKADFRIKIEAEAAGGNKLYIDNILLYTGPARVSNLNKQSFTASVFPNPMDESSVLSIEVENPENISVECYDIVGRKIASVLALKDKTTPIKQLFSSQEKGIYFVKIFNGVEIKTISVLF